MPRNKLRIKRKSFKLSISSENIDSIISSINYENDQSYILIYPFEGMLPRAERPENIKWHFSVMITIINESFGLLC